MVRRFWLLLAFAVAAVLSGGVARAQPAPRIVAIGDLHGDYSAWMAIARAAGLIDGKNRWAGGKTILVQTGDVPDRGPDTLKIIRHLMRLQREAPRRGGQVIALVGNHEAMNMTDDLRYVDPGEFAAFAGRDSEAVRERVFESNRVAIAAQYRATDPALTDAAVRARWMQETPLGWVEHRRAWRPDGEVGRWVMSNPAVAKVGANLFAHGGISLEYAAVPIEEINRRVATALAAGDATPTAIINDPLGPLWYRGLVVREPSEARPPIEQELAAAFASYGVKRLVIGHTPVLSGIAIEQGGALVRIDTGMSRHYGGSLSYVEIIGDRVIPHSVPRSGR